MWYKITPLELNEDWFWENKKAERPKGKEQGAGSREQVAVQRRSRTLQSHKAGGQGAKLRSTHTRLSAIAQGQEVNSILKIVQFAFIHDYINYNISSHDE